MVKKLAIRRKVATKPKTSRPKQQPQDNGESLDLVAKSHAAMLHDPCNSDLTPSVYSGDRGYVNRFVFNNNLGTTAGTTAWAYIIKPGNSISFNTDQPTSAATIAVGYANGYPGNVFLAANAAKHRCVALCTTIRPTAAPSSATGTIHFGIVNAASVANGTVVSVDSLVGLCSDSVSVSQALMQPLEVKWSPGGFDDRYSPTWTAGFTGDDDSDRNVLIVCGIGFIAASGVQARTTAIQEWSPKQSLGITNDATSVSPSKCDKECVLRMLKAKDKSWWWSLGKKTFNFGKGVTKGYYTGGAIGALGAAVRFATG